jgi:DAPG hydrolase PhiG domain
MDYTPSTADRAPIPDRYAREERYLGYRDADRAQPYAKYFHPTIAPVQAQAVEAIAAGRLPAELGYGIDEAAARLSRPGYDPVETGYVRTADGKLMIAVRTDMPGVRAEMWDWWFGWHGTESARYKLWHPTAHVFTAVGDDRSRDRDLTDRQRYIGNVSYVDEYVGHEFNRLTVRFVDPRNLGFDEPGPGHTVIAARGGTSTAPVAFAWLIHQVQATADGSEMRSRFFVGDTRVLSLPRHSFASAAGSVLTGPVGRILEPALGRLAAPDPDVFGPALLMHCAQEMNHLARFLPQLYEEFAGTP